MAGVVPVLPRFRFVNPATGAALANGSVTVYLSGSTTLANTYQDKDLQSANTNPVNLDANGECLFWVSDANTYKFLLTTGPDGTGDEVTGWPVDDIPWNAASAASMSFTQSGTGAVTRTAEEKLREGFVSVADFGADNTGVASCTTEVGNARTVQGSTRILLVPEGTYNYNAATYDVDGDFLWLQKGYAGAVNPMSSAENNAILVTFQTPAGAVLDAKQSRVGISVTGFGYGAQHASGVRANLYNSSTNGQGNTAFYGHAQTDVDALGTFVLHGEARHGGGTTAGLNVEMGSFTGLGTLYGAVINNTTASLNAAGATNVLTGATAVSHPSVTGVFVTGTNNTNAMGGWVRGIHFHANSMRANGNTIQIDANAVVDCHFRLAATAPSATADVWLSADSPIGVILGGTYGTSALRINAGERIGLEQTNAVKFGWDTGSLSVQYLNAGVNRVSLDLSGTPGLRVSGTKVVGERATGWGTPTATQDKSAFANGAITTFAQVEQRLSAIQNLLISHGLAGT